jgi:hypothetical protein
MKQQKNKMIGSNNFVGSQGNYNQKILSSSAGYQGIMTHGHGMMQGSN